MIHVFSRLDCSTRVPEQLNRNAHNESVEGNRLFSIFFRNQDNLNIFRVNLN